MTNDTPPRDHIGAIPIAGDIANKPATGLAAIAPRQEPTTTPPTMPVKPRQRHRLRWLTATLTFGLLLYTMAGYVLVPYLFHTLLPGLASSQTGRSIAIGGASFNPFTLTLTLRNAIVGPEPNGPVDQADPLLSCGWLEADLEASSLLLLRLNVQRLHINELFLHVQRFADNTINLTSLLPAGAHSEADRYSFAVIPVPFSLSNITIANSRLLFEDRKTSQTYTIEQIRLGLPYFANRRNDPGLLGRLVDKLGRQNNGESQFIRPEFSATVNGSPVRFTGTTQLTETGTETSLNLALKALNLTDFWNATPGAGVMVMDKGVADLDLRIIFTTSRDSSPTLRLQGTAQLHDLWLRNQQGQEIAKVPQATLTGSVSPMTGDYHCSEVVLEQPVLHVERDPDGTWSPLLGGAARPTSKESLLEVERLKIIDGRVSLVDRQVTGGFAMTWSEIQCTAESLSTAPQKTGKFALTARTGERGGLSLQGELALFPMKVSGVLVCKDFDLQNLAPYLSLTNDLSLRGGRLENLEAGFLWQQGAEAKGNLSLVDVNLRGRGLALDRQGQAVVELPEFAITKGALMVADKRLDLGELRANRARLMLAWDGNDTPALGLPLPGKDKGWQTRVSSVNMREAQFMLRRAEPALPLDLTVTEVTLIGSGLEVSGLTGVPDPSLSYNLQLHVIGVNLPVLSPYLEADLGYPIRGGSLELSSNLHREQDNVTADNTLTITELLLGVPKASHSRLPLTVALLTDERGVITTDIPVIGRMDDPGFSMPRALLKGIRNLLIRTTASPFTLLASSSPDQPVQDYVPFPFGRSLLAPENEKTLMDLADILRKRPRLRLTIKGFSDASSDQEALLAQRKTEQLKKQLAREANQVEEERLPDQESEPVVNDKALATLARQRAEEVGRYLVENMGLGKERIKEADDTGLVPKGGLGRSGNRVQFSLESMTP